MIRVPPSVSPHPTRRCAILLRSTPHILFNFLPFSLSVGAKSATLRPLAPFVRFLFCCRRFFISIFREEVGGGVRGLDLLAFRFWVTGVDLEAATRIVAAVAAGAMVVGGYGLRLCSVVCGMISRCS